MSAPERSILQLNAFDARGASVADDSLLGRRLANAGATSVLFYADPIEMVGARGTWMHAADGTRYLDFYNNVPSVGHCHPKVVEAVSTQLAVLNINTRYLNGRTERYLESLKARLPAELSNVALSCSGSEANDLAMRVAMKVTGHRGFVVTEHAYHGNTAIVTEISPSARLGGELPDHVVSVPAPGRAAYGDDVPGGFRHAVGTALDRLLERGHGVAAFVCDSIFSSDGVFACPSGFLAGAVNAVRARGGLWIADEVQPGFARTGSGFWGFEHHGIVPDMITMGKPMGNGYPMAGVAARADDLAAFCADVGYFNTFAGSPVAAAAGQAVLDVIDEEGLEENARTVGAHLLERLRALAGADERIAEVRGEGLFLGVELCREGDPSRPDAALASATIEGLRRRHVLIGATGRFGNTLKVRPPLCLTIEEADFFVDALGAELSRSR